MSMSSQNYLGKHNDSCGWNTRKKGLEIDAISTYGATHSVSAPAAFRSHSQRHSGRCHRRLAWTHLAVCRRDRCRYPGNNGALLRLTLSTADQPGCNIHRDLAEQHGIV